MRLLALAIALTSPSAIPAEPAVERICAPAFLTADAASAIELEPLRSDSTDATDFSPRNPWIPESGLIGSAAASGDWSAVSTFLSQAGLPNRKATLTGLAESSYPGVILDLDAPSDDLLMTNLRRLKDRWRKAGGRFPRIAIVDTSRIHAIGAEGAYLTGPAREPEIQVSLEAWMEYLQLGELPSTLSHELRHADFDRLDGIGALRNRVYRGSVRALTGSTGIEGYSRFVSVEEAYNHFRDLRKKLARIRKRLVSASARNVSDGRGLILSAAEAAESGSALAQAVNDLVSTAMEKVSDRSAAFSVPLFLERGVVTWEEADRVVLAVFPCKGCSKRLIGRSNAGRTFFAEKRAEWTGALKRIADATARTHQELEKLTHRTGALTGAERVAAYDAAIRPLQQAASLERAF